MKIPVMKEVSDYKVINKNGKSFYDITKMKIKLITEKSYVGDLYDSNNICIARDRRFFFENAIHPQLEKWEKAVVKDKLPDDKWIIPDIKLYLNFKKIDYSNITKKADLLSLLTEVRTDNPETIIEGNDPNLIDKI